MRKNEEKMDLSSCNQLLWVPAGSHGFWAHDPLPDPSHDPDVDPRRVTIPLAFTTPGYRHVHQPVLARLRSVNILGAGDHTRNTQILGPC